MREVEPTISPAEQQANAERNVRAALAQLAKQATTLEAALASDVVMMPLAIVEIRGTLARCQSELERLHKCEKQGVSAELVREYEAIRTKLEPLLQAHDKIATPVANERAIQDWLARDLQERVDLGSAEDRWVRIVAPASTSRADADKQPAPTTDKKPVPGPNIPVGGGAKEIEIEVGTGHITGSAKVVFEAGANGYGGSVGPAELKAMKAAATLKLNGLAKKLEASVLSGEIDFEIIDGLKVGFEANVGKASIEGDEKKLEVLAVAIKVSGDVSNWFTQRGMKLTLEGSLNVDVTGIALEKLLKKYAAHLAKVEMARAQQEILVRELEELQTKIADAAKRHEEMDKRRANLITKRATTANADELASIDKQISKLDADLANDKRMLKDSAKHADELVGKLDAATRHVDDAARAVEKSSKHKMARFLARKMATEGVQRVGRQLLRFVPVINVIATIVDVVEVVTKIDTIVKAIRSGKFEIGIGSSPSSEKSKDEAQKEGSGDGKGGKREKQPKGKQPSGPITSPSQVQDKPQQGPITEPSQVDGRGSGSKQSGNRVKNVPSKGSGGYIKHGPITEPRQLDDPNDPYVIIETFPYATAKQWFAIQGKQVVFTPIAKQWQAKYVGKHHGDLLVHAVELTNEGEWKSNRDSASKLTIKLVFDFTKGKHHHRWVRHFWVTTTSEGLAFEPFTMINVY